MATTRYTTARRMDYNVHGGRHIGSVKLLDGTILTRQEVLNGIQMGHEFHTEPANSRYEALVRPMRCASCPTTYLTTSADASREDNLDHLPTF